MPLKFLKYSFSAKIWRHDGPGGWHFVTLPKILSKKIRKNHGLSEEGWGRLRAKAKIGNSVWMTAIWYDSKHESYLLPVKSSVRKSEEVGAGSKVSIVLLLQDEPLLPPRRVVKSRQPLN